MDDPTEAARVVPELYFLIAKFLSGGPLKETAKTLIKELEKAEVLPRRVDWEGAEHSQSYHELASQYVEMPWDRLAAVCARALQLERLSRALPPALRDAAAALTQPASEVNGAQAATGNCLQLVGGSGDGVADITSALASRLQLRARLSLLSAALVAPPHKYAPHRLDHSLVRRLIRRESGVGPTQHSGGPAGAATGVFPPRLLSGLRLQRRTLGHLSAVYCLVLDTTGRYVITGADDLLVKVWSAVDGRLVATLRGAGAEITDVAVSADGALVAAGSVERLVRVWCLATAAPKAVLHAHQGTITSVHWAPPWSGSVRWLASTSTDGSVALWTCSADGQFLSQPVQYVERMRPGPCHMICAAWSAGGGFLAAGSADQHVRIYCIDGSAPPRRVLEVAVHTDAVDSLAWSHRGLRLVSGSKDGSAALWRLHATQWRHTLLACQPLAAAGEPDTAKRLKVTMVCWDCSDRLVLTACSDCAVRVWCATRALLINVLRGHRDEAYVLEAHPFLAGVVLSAGHDGHLFVWDAAAGEVLSKFHNEIPGQGEGAIFDAKWAAGGAQLAASDSHGHLLLLGLGQGHRLLAQLPTELFFHTDYRPLTRDALGGALDEQTETPPHLMAPPFLVDVEGAPHAARFQRLVPGRERLAPPHLLPHLLPAHAHDPARSRIDEMIEALAAERRPAAEARGVWRGEGVRRAGGGDWTALAPAPLSTAPIVAPLPPAAVAHIEATATELNQWEMAWYRREMRRRPVMITVGGAGAADAGPHRRRPGRRPAQHHVQRPRPRPRVPEPAVEVEAEDLDDLAGADDAGSGSDSVSVSSEESDREDGSEDSGRARRRARARPQRAPARARRASDRATTTDTDISISYSSSLSGGWSSSSQYSDWEAGAALAPPQRARRRPVPAKRYSPTAAPAKRSERPAAPAPSPDAAPPAGGELPELYRPGEWLCALSPRKAPYHPQMGDHCLYFTVGHQRYFEAVAEKDLYKVTAKDKPWERTHVYECEQVQVVGLKYVIRPPRVAALRLACALPPARTITVRYHDMADVIDFLVLKQQYEVATQRRWGQGDRFRCMIDDSWWTGIVLERCSGGGAGPSGGPTVGAAGPGVGDPAAAAWAAEAASHFLSLKVRWDNGEIERLSPWDLEPLDPERLPPEPGGCVPVLPAELEAALYTSAAHEWPPTGDRKQACSVIAQHISQVMTLSAAEPFVAPVDLAAYPTYALVVPYPIDLATVRARFQNLFYRRLAAAQFDVRYLASNAERFNEPHSVIVRQARLVTDLLLAIMSNWTDIDVVAKYHELAAAYHSSDDEPLVNANSSRSRKSRGSKTKGGSHDWRTVCGQILLELNASADSEPFRQPVSVDQAPDYHTVVREPMDLGTVQDRLTSGQYTAASQFLQDVRKVFTNSRLYNTNTRSRIYSMTVRLSSLFESLWSRAALDCGPHRVTAARGRARSGTRSTRSAGARKTRAALRNTHTEHMNGSVHVVPATSPPGAGRASASLDSDSEPLADTSRRVHAARAARTDSWDSDVPLRTIHKGKGVGKKSKRRTPSEEPVAGPSHRDDYYPAVSMNGAAHHAAEGSDGGGGGGGGRLRVTEEELHDDVQLTYESDEPLRRHASGRKRRRHTATPSSSSGSDKATRARRKHARHAHHAHHALHTPKRTRERFTAVTSSSSSGEEGGARGEGGRRYESDHSYKPRYSTDDDQPLHMLRQRTESNGAAADQPGPSTRTHNGLHTPGDAVGPHKKKLVVRLRARTAARRYNEDSEEDSVAAISKRLPHHHARASRQRDVAARSRRHHHAAMNMSAAALVSDHDYHGAGGAGGGGGRAIHGTGDAGSGRRSRVSTEQDAPAPAAAAAPPAVSISSRGRVRKLTAKARGLLRD